MKKDTFDKLRETLCKLFRMLGSPNEHERNTARQKIDELAAKHNLSWNDVCELVGVGTQQDDTAKLFEELLKGAHRKQADILVEIAHAADMFRTANGRVWADVHIKEHRETWPVRSTVFKRWLRHQFYNREKTTPTAEGVEACLCHLEAVGHCEGLLERQVYIRVAGLDDRVYLDLCDDDWSVIEADASGWRVIKDPPVRFHRTPGMLPLPFPTNGGQLSELRKLLNVSNDDFVLLIGWLLAALRGRKPYPILAMAGPPGSSKSTAINILRNLIDPNEIEPGGLPREERDLAIASSKRLVLAFDNLSGISGPISDMLCRLSTGGGFSVRQLFTDDEETVFSYTRPVVLAGIEDVVGKHDLSDRTNALTLEPISASAKKTSAAMNAAFMSVRPCVLGRLLDIVAHGFRNFNSIHVEKLPRMADYALWMAACETAEWPKGTFARAYHDNKENLAAASLEADIVAGILVDMLDGGGGWTGTAKELLAQVDNRATEQQKRAKDWPKTPHAMAIRVRRASEILRQHGWRVRHARSSTVDHSRLIIIEPGDRDAPGTSEMSKCPMSNDSKDLVRTMFGRSDDASDIVQTSSDGKPLKRLNIGHLDISDVARPHLSPCAFCGESDPPPRRCSWGGEAVLLHTDCEEYWVREHEADDVLDPRWRQ